MAKDGVKTWPSKYGVPGSPSVSAHLGISDLSEGPTFIKMPASGCVCTPLVDEQQRIYITDGKHPKGGGVLRLGPTFGQDGQFHFFGVDDVIGTPALLDGNLLICSEQGWMISYDTNSMQSRWIQKFCGACPQDHWSAAAANGTVVVPGVLAEPANRDMLPPADHVFALDASNGTVRWKFKPATMLHQFTGSIDGDSIVFTDMVGGIYCLKLSDGSVIWQLKGEGSMIARANGSAVAVNGAVYQAFNLKGKKAWNAPCGGKGVIRAYDRKSGKQKWDCPCDLEANATPAVVHKGPGGKPIVVVGLGANTGSFPPAPPSGDEWKGRVVALDATTGRQEWAFEPEPHKGGVCKGASALYTYKTSAWSSAVSTADGTILIGWHGGNVYALNSATGEQVSSWSLGTAVHGTPAIFENGVVVAGIMACGIWLSTKPQPIRDVVKDLPRPFQESGTQHFCTHRLGERLDKPYISCHKAPLDLSKPTWCYRPPNRQPNDWYLGGPAIDSQRNIIVGSMNGLLKCFLPDGTLRWSYSTVSPTNVYNPGLIGKSIFFTDSTGYVYSCDLNTMESNWSIRPCNAFGLSGSGMSVFEDTLLIGGSSWGINGEDALYAVDASNGHIKWIFRFSEPGYNTFPNLLDDGELVICGTCKGGWYALNLADGSLVSEWHPVVDAQAFCFSTGGPTVGPGGCIYVASNHPMPQEALDGQGCLRAFDVRAKKMKWEKTFDTPLTQVPTVVPKALTGHSADTVVVGAGHQVCGEANDQRVLTQSGGPFKGKLVGIDTENGKELWAFEPPPLLSCYPAGASDGDAVPPDAWSSAVVDARGTLYVCWQGGVIYAINSANGIELASYNIGSLSNGSPAIAPGMLVICAMDRVICWRDPELETQWVKESDGDPRAVALPVLKAPEATEEVGPVGLPMHSRNFDDILKGLSAAPAAGGSSAGWVVVGGADKGGIVVRKGESTKSAELGRLATGAKIKEIERNGERLHYEKVSGDGPASGWVSVTFKGAPLVKPE